MVCVRILVGCEAMLSAEKGGYRLVPNLMFAVTQLVFLQIDSHW